MMTENAIDSISWPTPVSPLMNRRMDALVRPCSNGSRSDEASKLLFWNSR